MDSLITAAARALAAGDALGALKLVALRGDPPALALRGVAMAQLGELVRARELLRRAARAFGAGEDLARARCVVAEAEVALAMRDFGGSPQSLASAAATLQAHGDFANVLQARLIAVRRTLLLGRLDQAHAALASFQAARGDAVRLPAVLEAVAHLAAAELALRSMRPGEAVLALRSAHGAAMAAHVPALLAEVASAQETLERPAARLVTAAGDRPLRLAEISALLASGGFVVDACRRRVGREGREGREGRGGHWVVLARRPVLFALAWALARAWPGDAVREDLIATVFRTARPDETHRARLRVEMGRLRALLRPLAAIEATGRGFRLAPAQAGEVVLLAPPIDGDQAALLALLSDGAAWSTSALAMASGEGQRTLQRDLAQLQAAGRARSIGKGRAQRWLAPPIAGFTTILLLPASLPAG